ncbi:uncharacterized protein LOC130809157 [Amaranthus tricolor]|uniref:uncharacterized protein LOC130809157 n=1 Tax=Amaranthus tricolor TaxID=29722 RepID=UPI002586E449|nr:uncharacterized protein LOC130809157 [Amaranthus tricolor]
MVVFQSLLIMESSAIPCKKIDQIQEAIHQLIESKQPSATLTSINGVDDEHQQLIKLISQLESLKEDELVIQSESMVELKSVPADEVETKIDNETETLKEDIEIRAEDVNKRLKKIEKQNKTTHWLLSALIVLTIAWQASEVSLLLKLKEGFSHPLKSFTNMVVGMIKRPKPIKEESDTKSLLTKVNDSMDISGLINGDEA